MRIRALLVSVALLMAVYCFGQRTTCELVGTVTDSSGAVVPGADVTITNTATGIARTGKTNDLGDYRFPDLLPGSYTLHVARTGFRTADVQPFTLYVDQQARQDVRLEVGATTQTITVSAGNVALETENATQGQVIENKEIVDLPLNGRNFMQLAQLAPGVIPIGAGMTSSAATWSGHSNVDLAIGGLREDDVSYLYDGIETRNSWYGAVGLRPNIDAIQEFKVQETGSSAAYGAGGAFVNVVSKSGTNTLHGTLYEFLRNNDVDARNFFDIGPAPPFRQNQFGASLGGDIARNKLFYFVNYEGFRQSIPNDVYTRVPTAAQDQGNFSALPITLMNPFTGTPFPGNVITPSTLISPIAQKILTYYPAPNGSYPGNLNFFVVTHTTDNWDQVNGRFDYNVSNKDRIFFRYTWQDESLLSPGIDANAFSTYPANPRNAVAGWSRTISPTTFNDFRLGWNHSESGEIRAHGYDVSWANPYGLTHPTSEPGSFGLPTLGVAGYANPGNFQGTNTIRDNIIMATDSLLVQRARHSISVGADIRFDPIYQYEDWASSAIFFNGSYTGDAVGDLLLGIPEAGDAAEGDPTLHWRRWYQAYYANDSIKLSHNLTLNAGIRWEYNQPPVDTRNHVGTFDFNTDQMLTYPAPNVLGLGRNMIFADHKNFSPRIGLAWVPFGKNTVIRAGYGLYYLQANINQYETEVDTPEHYLDYTISNPGPAKPILFTLSQVWDFSSATPFLFVAFEDPHNKTPYTHEWNFSVEHTFGRNWLVELAYNGSAGHHLEERPDINAPLNNQPLPYPNYTTIVEGENGGNSNYNALQARIQKRYSSGLSFLGSYTYSKCLSYPWEDQLVSHPYDMERDYGNCTLNVSQRLVLSTVYDLPVGIGKRYLNSGILSNILGGWEVSQIAQFETGPYVFAGGSQYVGIFDVALPNVIGPVNNSTLRSNIRKDNLGPYFNVQNFQAITACCGIQGDEAWGSIKFPGINNWDLSIFKNWRLYERLNLLFRTDFFNAFNHAQFNGLSTGIAAPNFGYVTSAAAAREIQFSLRLAF
jgi:hypothetical protein